MLFVLIVSFDNLFGITDRALLRLELSGGDLSQSTKWESFLEWANGTLWPEYDGEGWRDWRPIVFNS